MINILVNNSYMVFVRPILTSVKHNPFLEFRTSVNKTNSPERTNLIYPLQSIVNVFLTHPIFVLKTALIFAET